MRFAMSFIVIGVALVILWIGIQIYGDISVETGLAIVVTIAGLVASWIYYQNRH